MSDYRNNTMTPGTDPCGITDVHQENMQDILFLRKVGIYTRSYLAKFWSMALAKADPDCIADSSKC